MITRNRSNTTNSKTEKKPNKKGKGLLSIEHKPAQQPKQYAAEHHPAKKPTNKITDDKVIKERVIEINDKDLEGIAIPIETGHLLNKLEAEIDHGKWLLLFKGHGGWYGEGPAAEVQFRFGARKAQMLMTIAADPFCGNPNNYSRLPLSYNGMYEAVRKISKYLPGLFDSEELNIDSTHEDIKKVINRIVGGTDYFDRLRDAVDVITAYQKRWPDAVLPGRAEKAFWKGKYKNEERVDMEAFADLGAWLTDLYEWVDHENSWDDDDEGEGIVIFNPLVRYVDGIAKYMRMCPEPPVLKPSHFLLSIKEGRPRIDMKALKEMPAWLQKLHDANYEKGNEGDESDPGHPPFEPENPDAEPERDDD